LGSLGNDHKLTDTKFDNVFATIDKDGSGTIEKTELAEFVRKLMSGDFKLMSAEVTQSEYTEAEEVVSTHEPMLQAAKVEQDQPDLAIKDEYE
jgi:Ca2+-binding EF-hand superfamily protein